MEIKKDKVVSIEYLLHDAAGKLIDSSDDGEPLVYLHGNDNLVPGLEKHLEGRKAGDSLDCVVSPSEGYGVRDEELVMEVARKDFGPGAQIETGMQFEARGEGGSQIVTVVKVGEEKVTIDANHPLAGESLHFQVKVVDVRDATAEELSHGHVHAHAHEGCGCGCGDGCGDECGEGCGDECGCEDGCGDGCGG